MAKPLRARRVNFAAGLEALESRALLSVTPSQIITVWTPSTPLAPASTVLVKFVSTDSTAQEQADLDHIGARIVTSYTNGPTVVALPPGETSTNATATLKALPDVIYAEADSTVHATGAVIPNDPKFSQQYGLSMIDAPAAWSVTTGTSNTVVAVLDTGLDLRNADLLYKLWTNPSPGSGGFRNDLHGWNFVNNTSNIQDNNGHGSHVSGILAAASNNGVGVAGVDWGAQIMPLKVLDATGSGTTDAAISAVYYAVNHGAKVINASWGGDVFSQAMLDALNYANSAGVVFVTAAGNDSLNNDAIPTYPASYRTPNELVVASVDQNGNLSSFSNYGATTVDVAAPGENIISTVVGGYAAYSGTSMSTPFVAGTVALVAGLHPNYTASQLTDVIRSTAKPIASLNGLMRSPGIVDAYYALINHQTFGVSGAGQAAPPVVSPGNTSFVDLEATILGTDSAYVHAGNTPATFVNQTYSAILNRLPTLQDVSYLTTLLQTGFTRLDVIRYLQNTTEAYQTRVARWYHDELGSPLSVDELKLDTGVQYWAGLLSAGQSDAAVEQQIFITADYYGVFGTTPDEFAASIYPGLIGRAPTAEDIGLVAAALQAGATRAEIALWFLGAPEHQLTVVARLFQTELGRSGVTLDQLKLDPGVIYWASFLGNG